MKIKEFEQKVSEISKDFSIKENPNRAGLSNIFYRGENYDLPVIDSADIPDTLDQNRRYQFPNGFSARLWSVDEILDRLKAFIKNFEDIKENYEK